MEALKCFVCHNAVKKGLNSLRQHLQTVHGLIIKRGFHKSGFQCGQNGCYRRCQHFYSLRDHIRKNHFRKEDGLNLTEGTNSVPVDKNIINNDLLDGDDIINDDGDSNICFEKQENQESLQLDKIDLKDSLIKTII